MIRNPYPVPTTDEDKMSCRFQTYLSGEDKGLLFSIRPIRGTPQAVINHLIKNLCNDLRQLNITSYHPDADDIFAILVEPRQLTTEQISRIRRTFAGTNKQVSTGVQQYSGGTSVRQGLTSSPSGSNDSAIKTIRRKQQDRKSKSKAKKDAT